MSVSSMGSEDKDIQLHMYLFTIYFTKECWRLHHSYCFAMENNMKNQFSGILLDKWPAAYYEAFLFSVS